MLQQKKFKNLQKKIFHKTIIKIYYPQSMQCNKKYSKGEQYNKKNNDIFVLYIILCFF